MDLLAAAVGLKSAITQQSIALSVLKQSADVNAEIANLVSNVAQTVNASNRGSVVNITA